MEKSLKYVCMCRKKEVRQRGREISGQGWTLPNGSLCRNVCPTMWVLLKVDLPNLGCGCTWGLGEVHKFPEIVGSILQVSFYAFFWVHSFCEVCIQGCERFKEKDLAKGAKTCVEGASEKRTNPWASVSLSVIRGFDKLFRVSSLMWSE